MNLKLDKILNALSNIQLPDIIKSGAVGVLPTDTVYGLVCSATNHLAVEKLYNLKHRHHKPGTIIAASVDQLVELGLKRRYLTAVEQFWPNPISVVISCGPELAYLHLGKGGLAVRIPNEAQLLDLLNKTGPLLTTSANHPGEPGAVSIQQASDYFGNSVDFYVEGGNFADHKPSTVIRVVDDAIEILRQGALKIDESGKIG